MTTSRRAAAPRPSSAASLSLPQVPGAGSPGSRSAAPGNAGEPPVTPGGAGVVLGLALTSRNGRTGATAATVECLPLPGRGKLILTGNLIGSARDAAQLAVSLVRARAERFGLDPVLFLHTDFHFHVMDPLPPKGGPSIGLPMFVALVSALTRTLVAPTCAFTGELSLTGAVLPVEGLAAKVRAAARAGAATVYAPAENVEEMKGKKLPQGLRLVATDRVDVIDVITTRVRPSP